MAKRPIQLAITLSTALNYKFGCRTVINTKKFYDEAADRTVTLYSVSDSARLKSGEYRNKKLYQTSSSVFLCYFLQDLLYSFEGKELSDTSKDTYIKTRQKKGVYDSISYMLSLYQ